MDITLNTNMATDVSNAVIQVINNLCEKFGIAFDWTAENVWPTLQALSGKFAKMIIISNWVEIILCILISIGLIKITIYFEDKKFDTESTICLIASTVFVVITVITVIFDASDLVRCYTFPEFAVYKHIMEELEGIM